MIRHGTSRLEIPSRDTDPSDSCGGIYPIRQRYRASQGGQREGRHILDGTHQIGRLMVGTLCMVKKGMCPVFTLAGFPVPVEAILKIFAKMDGELGGKVVGRR